MFKLRDYQQETVEKNLKYFNSKNPKPTLTVSPVGSGKSLIIGSVASQLDKTLVLQPSKELLIQNYNKLLAFGGSASIYSASMKSREIGDTTYATLGSVKKLGKDFKKLGIKNVIIDECHLGYSPKKGSMFQKFLKDLQPEYIMGYTATPVRLKAYQGYSQLNMLTRTRPRIFHSINHIVPIKTMVDNGYWSKLKYELYDFDESILEFNSNGSDFTEQSIRQAVKDQNVNNNIYLRILSLLKEGYKNILVVMDSVDNCEIMAKTLGDFACVVSSRTKQKLRDELVSRFKESDIKVVCNYGTLTTGFDHPLLDAVIIGRPSNSLQFIYQVCGRGVRIHKDKDHCLIIDYCNNMKRLGKLEDLTIENYKGYGWGMFNKDKLLTGTPLGVASVYKDQIGITTDELIVWFGKHKGKPLSKVPLSWMKYILKEFDFNTVKMKYLRDEVKRILKKESQSRRFN